MPGHEDPAGCSIAFVVSEQDKEGPEKREGARLEHPVMVAYRTVDRFLCDFGTNISQTGIFVNTPDPLPVGTPVRLLVSLPEADIPELRGRVTRVQPAAEGVDPGMGVEFIELPAPVRSRLDALVHELREKLGQDESD
ncbi:MAG: TIGR02266 family protein [Deltaproteobacteria bacterium]|nr:TIGR02266 family protein [Deltaproteobacteria bacterium]